MIPENVELAIAKEFAELNARIAILIKQRDEARKALESKVREALRLKTFGPLGPTYSDAEIVDRVIGGES